MKHNFSRRDFLKLASSLPFGLAAPRFMRAANPFPSSEKQNVLVVVFDALSASNISFHGYRRETTPNLARLSERAVVYHNHYSTSNYTTPGTASLLTGTLPWTNRAFRPNSQVADSIVSHNIFNAFEDYYRIAYTHNGYTQTLLKQFARYMEELVPRQKLFLNSYDSIIHSLFANDDDIATVGWTRTIDNEQGYSYSLFLSHLYKTLRERIIESIEKRYPRGIPSTNISISIPFLQEHATDWLGNRLAAIPQPFLGYFHFLPPHAPYRTSMEFYNRFEKDSYKPVEKPIDLFAEGNISLSPLKERTQYDEFILYADKAFGDLYASMEESGLLENTWVVFTSDHGEMFERGLYYHRGPTLYQPVIHIPLLIFEPGRKIGVNIHTKTSTIDVLSTLLHVTGHEIPNWAEGVVLPPYAPIDPDINRTIFTMTAEKNKQYEPFTQASTTLIKGRYKLIYCFGYPKIGRDEVLLLFDIEADPEELVDLYPSQPGIAKELLEELKAKLTEVNGLYPHTNQKETHDILL